MATPPPAPSLKCHYRSCRFAGSNHPRITCYAPGCDRALHSFCYDLGVRRKNVLDHFDPSNLEPPFSKIACRKDCFKKAFRHLSNVTADPEDRNIPWNRDGREGGDDPNNSENILIAWLQHPGNYNKFRSPTSGMTKVAVCEEISRKINRARTLKVRKAPSVQLKIQAMESAFRYAHDWINNTGEGVRERDGPVTFEEAVKKRFSYYYDLVDVMSDRASARPRASTDTMNMANSDTSSSSSPSSDDGDDDDDGATVHSAPFPAAATAPTRRDEDEDIGTDFGIDEDDDELVIPFRDPAEAEATETPTVVVTTGITPGGGSSSSLTSAGGTMAAEATAVSQSAEKEKRKSKNKKSPNKRSKNRPKGRKNGPGTRASPHEIHDVDGGNSWQTSMLDIQRDKVAHNISRWSSEEKAMSEELKISQERWRSESKEKKTAYQQQQADYKYDLMQKYRKLVQQGFDNHQILKMIPDMRPIINKANMPVNLQISSEEGEDEDSD